MVRAGWASVLLEDVLLSPLREARAAYEDESALLEEWLSELLAAASSGSRRAFASARDGAHRAPERKISLHAV